MYSGKDGMESRLCLITAGRGEGSCAPQGQAVLFSAAAFSSTRSLRHPFSLVSRGGAGLPMWLLPDNRLVAQRKSPRLHTPSFFF